MRIQNGKEPESLRGDEGRHLARYRELTDHGDMPGLLLPARGSASSIPDADKVLREELAAQLCAGIEDEHRIASFQKGWSLAMEIASANRSGICASFPYDEFWSQALACGLAAHALSRKLERGHAEQAFLCGFLYRLGALALSCAFPTEYGELMEVSTLSELDELRSVERDLFGLDHLETSHSLLLDLEMPAELTLAILELSAGLEEGESELRDLILSAERIAGLCLFDESRDNLEWTAMMEMRRELGLERVEFVELGDSVVRQWWEYGDLLKIHTKAGTSFLELDDTGITERSQLGLVAFTAETEPAESLKVLVVDDDATALLILERQLQRGGHKVLTATNGAEALSSALQNSPDVVIADWMMPEMDGLELCRALRRYEAGRLLFFILLTGCDEEQGIIEAFESGVDDFFTKPSNQGVLLARMTAANRVLTMRRKIESDHRQLKKQLGRMAGLARVAKDASVTDSLTMLPNRRYATRRLAEEWSYSERTGHPFSIVMIDVDRFKLVNDTHGHDVGDLVLQRVAAVLDEATRKGEVACRFGGEEFLVICRETSEEEVRSCGERIRAAIEERVVRSVPFDDPVTVSVGIATRSRSSRNVDALVRAADQAVYRAKSAGRNRVC